jgi:geranylgeranylglycerol-phosphate geranylgeranyltransferase
MTLATRTVAPQRWASRTRAAVSLIRPATVMATWCAVSVGAFVRDHGVSTDVVLAALAAGGAVAAANAFNDLCDIETDRINRPDRPLPAGLLSMRAARVLATSSVVVAGAGAAAAGATLLAWFAALACLAVGYSTTFKRRGPIGVATIGVLFGSTVLFGALAAGGLTAAAWVGASEVGLVIAGREIVKSIPDEVGDRATGVDSVAIRFGWRRATQAFVLANIAALAVAAAAAAGGVAPVIHAVALGLGVTVPAIVAGLGMLRTGPAERCARVLAITCWCWLTGLASVALLGWP